MNEIYLVEYTNVFERLLSYAHENGYSFKGLERDISRSSFFQHIEKYDIPFPLVVDDNTLARSIFSDPSIDLMEVRSYNQCMWAAEAYLRIQNDTRLSFEAIFLYIPIVKMFDYFQLYHEMDFSHVVNEFRRLFRKQSILSILINNFHYQIKYVSDSVGLSYDTLYSYKQRRRNIKKMSAETAYALASLFKVRMETLLELAL